MKAKHSFPFSRQYDAMDCGPTCLKMVAQFHGRHYSLQTLREKCHITREGVSMLGISEAAESIGIRTTGVMITWNQLREEVSFPCIVHWNQNHFVVVYAVDKKGRVFVADPASGLLQYESRDFLMAWCKEGDQGYGLALILEPTPAFYNEDGEQEPKTGFLQILRYLYLYRTHIGQILLAMLASGLISFLLPFITQAVVDRGVGTGSLSLVIILLIAQLMLTIGGMANNMVRNRLMLHVTGRVSISLLSDFLCKLMRLPIAFFDSKVVGDIMQRMGDFNRIQSFLTGNLLSMVIAVFSLLIYTVIMAGYNLLLFVVFLVGAALYIGWALLFMKRRRKLDYMRFDQASANQTSIVQLIGGMQDIKLNGCERQKRWNWENIQAKIFKVNMRSLSLGQVQELGGTLIDQTKNILISFVAAKSVIDGGMTLGMMMAMQYIVGQINAPIAQFIGFVQSAQDATISLERLGEIQELKDEEPEAEYRIREIPTDADIVFKDVLFQYGGPMSEIILDHVSLTIPSGKVTAIVGASGSGKTTMLKMMLGFYHPASGDIFLGQTPLKKYSESCWRKHCGSVMQEGFIFSDSIAGNIAISDDTPDMERVRQAAEVSNIDEWINGLPLGYNTKIGADGQGLSSGQKQRVLIARAAYKNARYLFLDEATNALDANNELKIKENLDKMFNGKTVVIAAHRLSTIKNADNIVVLDHGRIVEQGTHEQLTRKRGKYYELVKNQLELGNR